MSVFSLIENAKVIPAFVPKDVTAGVDGDLVDMSKCERLYIILAQGAWAGGTGAVTVTQETSAAGSSNTAVAFGYRWVGTALTTDVLVKTAVTSNTFNLATLNEFHIIEITPSMLTDGYKYVRVRVAAPSSTDLAVGLYVMTGLKYQGDAANIPTAIV